jgi:hypothetical protein
MFAKSPDPDRRRRLLRWGAWATGLAAIVAYYVFVVSAGRWTGWPSWSAFTDAQAEGFRAGHLYARPPAGRWDWSFYGGHYYLYWGLTPAALLAAWKTLFRVRGVVGDEVVAFVFAAGSALAGAALLATVATRVRARPPGWALALAVAVFALANPTPYTLNRAAIYEVAILAGTCFTLLGLTFGLRAVDAASPRAAEGWLAASGAAFGLAATSRVSLVFAAAAVVLLSAFARWRAESGSTPRLARLAIMSGAPLAAPMIVHFVLNRLRYGSWREFGIHYQLGFPYKAGLRFVVANLYLYLVETVPHSCRFPFLATKWSEPRAVLPQWLPVPADYRTEPVAGVLLIAPFVWLIAAPLVLLAVRRLRRTRDGAAAAAAAPADVWARRWIWIAPGLFAIGAIAPVLGHFYLSMRYELDFVPSLLVLAAAGGWVLLAAPRTPGPRAAATATYIALAVVTIVTGVLLGFGGYFDHFGRSNPVLLDHLRRALSTCR